jgi:hypothetical protein
MEHDPITRTESKRQGKKGGGPYSAKHVRLAAACASKKGGGAAAAVTMVSASSKDTKKPYKSKKS